MRSELDHAIAAIVEALRSGGTLYACGNGGSAAHAAHLVAELKCRFAYDRQSLRAELVCGDVATLTAIANDYSFAEVFARPALSYTERDVLVLFTTSGRSENVRRAVAVRRCPAVALTGPSGIVAPDHASLPWCEVRSQSTTTAAIQEDHQRWIHEIARRVEEALCPRT